MIAVITSLFNPQNYQAIKNNYNEFRENLCDCDLFVCEASFGEGFTSNESGIRSFATTKNNMFQKERMLNAMIAELPNKYDKVVWVDADLIYHDDKWLSAMEEKLDHYPVVQGFSEISLLDKNKGVERVWESFVSMRNRTGEKVGQPGGCWGANLKALPDYKMMDNHILGGGDVLQVDAWQGSWNLSYPHSHEQAVAFLYEAVPHYRNVHNNMGVINFKCSHLFHGSFENRKYMGRNETLKRNRFDPLVDIKVGDNGLWEWATDKPALHKDVSDYFKNRKEDE